MAHYLVVANQTLGGKQLLEELRNRTSGDPEASFHVVIPATPTDLFHNRTEGEAIAVAEERLDEAMTRFSELDAEITGEVGDHDPFDAVRDALREGNYDGIVLSTFPPGISRWLGMDLPSRVQRHASLPVTHIVTGPDEV